MNKGNDKGLLWWSQLISLVLLTFGCLIFFTWLIARNFFAVELKEMVVLGILWVIISIILGTLVLLSLLIYIATNFRHLDRRVGYTFLLLLINIPALYGIMAWEKYERENTHVKITNKTGIDDLQLNIKGKFYEVDVGYLDDGESSTFGVRPAYLYASRESIGLKDIYTYLYVSHPKHKYKIVFPQIGRQCQRLELNKDFSIIKQ